MVVACLVEISVASISFWIPTFLIENLYFSKNFANIIFTVISLVRSLMPFVALAIFRAINKAGLELDIEIDQTAELSDMDEVSEYAKEAVEFLVSKGAIKGSNGKFNPKAYATRAEAAQMIYNVIKIR